MISKFIYIGRRFRNFYGRSRVFKYKSTSSVRKEPIQKLNKTPPPPQSRKYFPETWIWDDIIDNEGLVKKIYVSSVLLLCNASLLGLFIKPYTLLGKKILKNLV